MTHQLCAAIAATIALAASPATADSRDVRRVSQRYMHSAVGSPEVFGMCYTVERNDGSPPENHGCVRFQTAARESIVGFRVVDDVGVDVPAAAYQDTDHDGVHDIEMRFCGESEPAEFADGEIVVWLNPTTWTDVTCPGTATRGVVDATFQIR